MDKDFQFGQIAASMAGHDKRQYYVVVGQDDQYVYLADGRLKKLDCPKRKNVKHVQVIHYVDEILAQKKRKHAKIEDHDLIKAIKLYETKGQI